MAWDEELPSGSTDVKEVDNIMRGDKITLRTALDTEHVFNEADQSGLHRMGAAVLIRDLDANIGQYTAREGQLFYATDKHKLYVGSGAETPAWQMESPRHLTALSAYLQADDVLADHTEWTALPGLPAITGFGVTGAGDLGSLCDLLITAQLTAVCSTDDGAIAFTLFLDGVSVVASAGWGLATAPYVNSPSGMEDHRNVVLTYLKRDVAQLEAGHAVQVRYKGSAGGVVGLLPAGYAALLSVVQL